MWKRAIGTLDERPGGTCPFRRCGLLAFGFQLRARLLLRRLPEALNFAEKFGGVYEAIGYCTFQFYAASFISLSKTFIIFFGMNAKFKVVLYLLSNMT